MKESIYDLASSLRKHKSKKKLVNEKLKSYSIQKNELNKIIDNESTRLANAIKRKRKKK